MRNFKFIITVFYGLFCALATAQSVGAAPPEYLRDNPEHLHEISEKEGAITAISADDYPPYSYQENGIAKGLSVDVLVEILKRAGMEQSRKDIIIMAWSRAYRETLRHKNTLLFSTVRTPYRESLFKWVGPIGVSRQVVVARRDNSAALSEGADFNQYRYGVMKNSSGEQRMMAKGVDPSRFIYVNTLESAAKLLKRGRYDAMVFDQAVANWIFRSLHYRPAAFKIIYAFEDLEYYFAFNKETDQSLIDLMQNTLDEIRADGTLAKITQKYLHQTGEGIVQLSN